MKPVNTQINHPAVCRGNELLTRKDWLHELTRDEIDEIQAEGETFPKLAERLHQTRASLENESGAAMIRGFPVREFSEDTARTLFQRLCREVGHEGALANVDANVEICLIHFKIVDLFTFIENWPCIQISNFSFR